MKFTNLEIYQIANALLANIQNLTTHIPAKANFFLQKNFTTIATAAQEIEKSRMKVAEHYGEKNEETQGYTFSDEKAAAANQELQDLFSIEQELSIKTFSIDDLGNAEFTPAQMQAIMFMIED